MKLPSHLLGALAVALTGFGMAGCSDLITALPKPTPSPKPAPKPKAVNQNPGGNGAPENCGPDGCPIDPVGGGRQNRGDECPGCGRG